MIVLAGLVLVAGYAYGAHRAWTWLGRHDGTELHPEVCGMTPCHARFNPSSRGTRRQARETGE